MPFLLQRALQLAACLALAVAPPDAAALWDDRLELFAVHAVTRDDNIFRLTAPELEDTYRSTAFGLRLDMPMSRQRLQGALELTRVRYERFDELDFDGHSGRVQWDWGLGDDLKGQLGYTQRRALASLASIEQGAPSRIPNVLTTRRAFAAGEALLGASWRLRLEGSRLEHENDAAVRLPNDLALERGEAGLSYVSRAGNSIGLRGRVARGSLPNPQPVGGLLVDNSYRQREAGVVTEWSLGGHSRLRAHLSRVRREYEQLPARDFEGNTWELTLDWTPTDKLGIAAVAHREISTIEEINLNFVLAEGIALKANYRPSGRTELAAVLETSDRRYLGDAGQALGIVPPFRDRLRAAGLQASYRPLRQVTLLLALQRQLRSANFAGGDYEASIASLGVRFAL